MTTKIIISKNLTHFTVRRYASAVHAVVMEWRYRL